MVDAYENLTTTLRRFLEDAMNVAEEARGEGTAMLPPAADEFAERVLGLRSAEAVNAAAFDAATAHGYLLREQGDLRAAGRELKPNALVETGVAKLLLSGEVIDVPTLVAELAGYFAGPAVPIWDYAIIDADTQLTGPVPVVDGWELVTPTTEELADLVGVPSAAEHAVPYMSFNLDLYGGLAMLRRVNADERARAGLMFYFRLRPAHALWQPLLALSLYQNAVVRLWAQHTVEPGRRVDVLFDRVYTEPWTPDGVTEIERVRRGDYEIDAGNEARFRRFCAMLAPRLEMAARERGKRPARLRRVAEHFLTASEDAHGEGEVLSEFNADAVLHYVIALEALLAGSDSATSDLARKTSQRSSVLVGRDDADRIAVAETVKAAYNARSAYAHGSEPKEIDLPELRRVVRDCILARLVLGDPPARGDELWQLADKALLHHACLTDEVHEPIRAFLTSVDLS